MPANAYNYSNAVFQIAKQNLNLETETVKAMIVSEDYTFDHTHVNRSEITNEVTNEGGTTGYEHKEVANIAITLASNKVKFDCDNLSYTAINTAEDIRAVIFFVDTANAATDTLIAYKQGLALATNGSDVEIRIDTDGFTEITNIIPA